MRDLPDLIRNYKLILKRKYDTDSETESQPLVHSGSSTSCRSFGSVNDGIFPNGSETDTDFESSRVLSHPPKPIPPVLLNKQNRKVFFASNYDTSVDLFESIFNRSGDKPLTEILTDASFKNPHGVFPDTYDYKTEPVDHGTHSSLVTIFAIWNTTVGTSLLAMPWGIEKTGLFPSIAINIAVAAICLYTTYTLLKINEKHGMVGQYGEVCDLCRALIGRWAEILAKIFSLVVLIGANIVYWILMSNFLYNSVTFIYESLSNTKEETQNATVLCPKNESVFSTITNENGQTFYQIWGLYSTVPVILAVIMFPLLNWKSPTFFTKFNSLGTFSVFYIILFVFVKAVSWGVHVPEWNLEFKIKPTFCVLSGMLSLSYFIHNIIISIMRNNRHQHRNGRDLSIAFGLVTFTYLFIGVAFYITFPLPKFCIEDNILNNFNQSDVMTIIGRILLLFQLFTVFPLISYMLRNDVFANIKLLFKNFTDQEYYYLKVMVLNVGILTTCVLFACFLPRIGTLIRYTGALSGLVYIFMLPSLLNMASLRKEGSLSVPKTIFHVTVMVVGTLNLLLQFFINDK